MIKDGIIQADNIFDTPFRVDLIPKTNKTSRPGNFMVAKYVTQHNTGNRRKGADAEMHTEYIDNTTGYVSWHFTVDDKQIIQELPIIENAWHAGDGGIGPGNRKSIGIETCEHEGIDWQKAKENTWKLWLFLQQNVTTLVEHPFKPHRYFSGKYCPRRILDEGWDKFMQDYKTFTLEHTQMSDTEVIEALTGVAYKTPEHWYKAFETGEFNPEYVKQAFRNMANYIKKG